MTKRHLSDLWEIEFKKEEKWIIKEKLEKILSLHEKPVY